MKGVIWALVAVLLMQSCAAEYSDTELAGIEAVHELYQGNITYSKHFGDEGDYFLIKLTDTEVPLELDNTLEIAGHNVGLIMFEHFSKEERGLYDWIKLEVVTSKGPQNRTVSMGMIRTIWNMEARSRDDLKLLETGKYGDFYVKLKAHQQRQFAPAVFDSLVGVVFAETGALNPPIALGVDTLGYKDTIIGTYYFVLKSAIDSTPRLAYRASYLLTDNDSIIDFGLQSLIQ